jgi:hypothetical protein
MTAKHLAICALLAVASAGAGAGGELPNRVDIRSEHNGWGHTLTNLSLTFTNGVFAAGDYTVPAAAIANVLAAAERPWPKPPANSRPYFTIDPENFGLTRYWLEANYERLLRAYSAEAGPAFPNASEQWAVLNDGRLLIYGFTGDGVLDWKPDELGFTGDARKLQSFFINRIGVFVGPQGEIAEVVQPQGK